MFRIPLDQLKEKIKEKGLSDEQLQEKIKQKMEAMSGLISEEGATHIIANELGVQVSEEDTALKINKLLPGMRGIELVGKVVRKFEVREFQSQSRSGKVGSLILGDESGTIRVAFWNDQADWVNKANESDVLKLKSVYVRENRGSPEVHVNDNTKVVLNPEGVSIDAVSQSAASSQQAQERKAIKDLVGGEENVEVLAHVVSVYNPTFFSICPECNKRVKQEEGEFRCLSHGAVQPAYSYVLNMILDDGTDTIRAVLWKNQTQRMLKKEDAGVLAFKDHPEQFDQVKTDLLGEMVKVVGRVKRNDMFDRLELNVNLVLDADAKEELQRLEQEN